MSGKVRFAPLGEVARFIRGITFKPTDLVPLTQADAVACMRTKNVQEHLDLSDVWGVPRSLVKREEQYLNKGDILVSTANSWNLVGKCCWVPDLQFPSTLGGFISAVRPSVSSVAPRYLYRWLSSGAVQAQIRACARQTTNIPNLSIEQCQSILVPLPSLDEQRRIAALLDQADDLRLKRRSAEHALERLAAQLVEATFQRATDWVTMERVADVQGGLQLSAGRSRLPRKAQYLRVANVYRNQLDLAEVKSMGVNESEIQRTRLFAGDILFVEGHGNSDEVGRCAVWDGSLEECVHQNHIIRSRITSDLVDPGTLCRFLNSAAGRRHLVSRGKTTSGLNTISVSDVRRTPVPLVSDEARSRLQCQLVGIERLKLQHRAHLAKLDVLFASLQHRAFRGEL